MTSQPRRTSSETSAVITAFLSEHGYDPALADAAVRRRAVLFDRRFWQTAAVAARFWLAAVAEAIFSHRGTSQAELKRARAARLKQVFVELGPTFIKVGQFLSVRRDLLPLELAEELSTLQDRVPPFELSAVQEIVTAEFACPPEEAFAYFDPVPLASASIGQVHRVRLDDGRDAVVKVQRPHLEELFYKDLGYMRLWARAGRFLGLGEKADSWLALSNEFGRTLFAEINYIQEGRNADTLRRLLRDDPRVRIPRVYWKRTGRRVLTLEYLPGVKIDRVEALRERGWDLREIGNLIVETYLKQIVFHGFFHADPHPGNLAIDDSGHLIVYDFGMMGEITTAQRLSLAGCVSAVISGDAWKVAEHLAELGVVREKAPLEPVARTLEPFIEYYRGRDIRDLDFRNLEHEVDQIILDQSLRLPPTLAYLLRAGSSLEGIARTLKPDFSFVQAARPVFTRLAAEMAFERPEAFWREFLKLSRSLPGRRLPAPQEELSPHTRLEPPGDGSVAPAPEDGAAAGGARSVLQRAAVAALPLAALCSMALLVASFVPGGAFLLKPLAVVNSAVAMFTLALFFAGVLTVAVRGRR